jgi:SAM-dependent methyltransferase
MDSDPGSVRFHHQDFEFEEHKVAVQSIPLPSISCDPIEGRDFATDWEHFFGKHKRGEFFKSRRYICKEFELFLNDSIMVLFEVGCGYGCTMIPLTAMFPNMTYIATDFSEEALNILKRNDTYNPDKVICAVLDIVHSPLPSCFPAPQCCLCVFALSAVHPKDHLAALKNIYASLVPGGYLLFRDYGIYDLTMFRHCAQVAPNFFQRGDKTFSYYFELEYLEELICRSKFISIELRYDCVAVNNRKTLVEMRRVFVHAVLKKPSHG